MRGPKKKWELTRLSFESLFAAIETIASKSEAAVVVAKLRDARLAIEALMLHVENDEECEED